MDPIDIQSAIDDATYDFTMGDAAAAVGKLEAVTRAAPDSSEAWHALAEIHFSTRNLDAALAAAEKAHALKPADLFVNTTLSRIWMERGDKPKAEHYGAQARMAGWRDELKNEPPDGVES